MRKSRVEIPVTRSGCSSISPALSDGSQSRWKRVLPWIGSLLLMGYLAYAYDVAAAWEAMKSARLGWVLALWLSASILVYFVDTGCLWLLFDRLNGPVSYRGLLVIKGASYFLNVVNYAAASGGIAYMVWRRYRMPVLEVGSSVLFLNAVDLFALNLCVTIGLLLGGLTLPPPALQSLVWVNIGIYCLYFGSMIYWNGGWDFLILGRLRTWSIFSAFDRAKLRIHAELIASRLLLLVIYVAMQYWALRLFDIAVPLGELLVYNSIITLVIIVPISIAGLGTSQMMMLAVYSDYGSDAQILAYSTASIVLFMVVRIAIGYACLGQLSGGEGEGAGGQR